MTETQPGLQYRLKIRARLMYGMMTSSLRILPNFLVIGVEKGGTTSLFRYLVKHPNVLPAAKKEIHYFSHVYNVGYHTWGWYRGHFPLKITRAMHPHQPATVGEASANYISHPHAPQRVAAMLPGVKIIALLRNPIDRAYSQYQHKVRQGLEDLSFEEAIRKEPGRMAGEWDRMMNDPSYYSAAYHYHAYVQRGQYAEQLERWFAQLPREQFLVLRSEDLFERPREIYADVLDFLGLPAWDPVDFKPYLKATYTEMPADLRDELGAHFQPHNQRLYTLLNGNMGWD